MCLCFGCKPTKNFPPKINMPRNKKLPPLVSPEQKAKEAKMTGTCAMGMKMTLASNDCWRNQILSEQRITQEWRKVYDPEYSDREKIAVDRVVNHDATIKCEREGNDLRQLLFNGTSKEGAGRAAYLKERLKLKPHEKQVGPLTVNQTIGWSAARTAHDNPLATNRQLYGRKGVEKEREETDLLKNVNFIEGTQ
jgi:hypothetical protein